MKNGQKDIFNRVIASVRSREDILSAASSKVKIVFHLSPDILKLGDDIKILHNAGKKVFIHIDLADGIGKDRSGVEYIKILGADGIISTRTGIIKHARELGIFAVQRFFIVDSQSVCTAIETIRSSKANMMEVMPGNITKVIKRLKETVDVPVIAGGLIETMEEASEILKSGAFAVSAGNKLLWGTNNE